jgi:hypothetical protein
VQQGAQSEGRGRAVTRTTACAGDGRWEMAVADKEMVQQRAEEGLRPGLLLSCSGLPAAAAPCRALSRRPPPSSRRRTSRARGAQLWACSKHPATACRHARTHSSPWSISCCAAAPPRAC